MHRTIRYTLAATTIALTLSACSGGGGGSGGDNPVPAAAVTLAVSSTSVAAGATVELTWSSTNANSCAASGGWTGTQATSGTAQVGPVIQTTIFGLSCTGSGGSGERSVTVNVQASAPELTLSASPEAVRSGETSTLTWSSQNATSCTASEGWVGAKATSGSETIAPVTSTTSYTLTCSNSAGDTAETVTVAANAVGGQLLLSSISRSDSDVNDPDAPYVQNDLPETAQPLPNPVVVGGYVNEPNRGPDGRSFATGDLDDFFQADLLGGQVIELLLPSADPALPDSERDDADLGLYDQAGNLVDASLGVGQVETLVVPSSGNYYVRVGIYSGAPLYRLSIGQSTIAAAQASLRLSDDFVPGEAIVTMKPVSAPAKQMSAQSIQTRTGMSRKAGHSSRELLLGVPSDASQRMQAQKSALAANRAVGVKVPPALQRKMETLQYLKMLRADPHVRAAEPNRILQATAVPNDPLYKDQRWHYELIQLPSAWNVTTGSSNVVVAIVDTGAVNHPDLAANRVAGYDFISNPSNQDGDGIDPNPDDLGCVIGGGSSFHGTHVAGTVAAASNNGSGVAGVTWNARLMPIRVLDGCGGRGTLYDIVQGIRYAAGLNNDSNQSPANRPDIINLSLGGAGACDSTLAGLFAEVRAQGVVVVAAAGNENTSQLTLPASCPNVIAVSSVGPTRQRAPYSNYGSWVDVAAPGGDESSDVNGDGLPDGVLSTYAAGGGSQRFATFKIDQGTSMAAPHMAGVVALMKSVDPTLTPAQVDTLLAQGQLTDDIGSAGRDELGVGLINAFKAVQAASSTPAPVTATLTLTPTSLNFGDIGVQTEVVASNGGSGALSITGTATSDAWISVAPLNTDGSNLGIYAIAVERAGLPIGSHRGWVDFVSSAGTTRVSLMMQVAAVAGDPDAGRQYVLLVNAVDGTTAEDVSVQARGASVPYRFDSVGSGDYLVVTGTDMNNDFFVCDDGEACGVYPVDVAPVVVTVAGESLGLDFATTFRANVRAAVAASAEAGSGREPTRRGFARKR